MNRSCLVVGRVLMERGMTAEQAIERVRQRRSGSLSDEYAEWLRSEEEARQPKADPATATSVRGTGARSSALQSVTRWVRSMKERHVCCRRRSSTSLPIHTICGTQMTRR
jgi:hypothetical protein